MVILCLLNDASFLNSIRFPVQKKSGYALNCDPPISMLMPYPLCAVWRQGLYEVSEVKGNCKSGALIRGSGALQEEEERQGHLSCC